MKRLSLLMLMIGAAGTLSAQEVIHVSKNTAVKTVYKTVSGLSNFEVELRGTIELADDDRDIKSMSSDGYLEIRKTVFGSKRKLIISPEADGLKREYYEGRTKMPFEPEGRKWMAEILPELVRSTTIGAESRVNRFFNRGGAQAVLNEIENLQSDYVKHHYANKLMKVRGLEAKDYAKIINTLANEIDSDYYLSEFLKYNADKLLSTQESTDALLAATNEIDSDHYKTEVIKEALRQKNVSAEGLRSVMTAASKIGSDHYKAEVLNTLLRQRNLTTVMVTEVLRGTQSINSDHYRTLVLQKALAHQDLPAAAYQNALESVRQINSDHYKTEVLKSLLNNQLPPEQMQYIVNVSASIKSDHYLTEVFTTIMRKQELNDESFKTLVNAVDDVNSDYYAATVLRAALSLPNLSEQKIESILKASTDIDSDHYLTEVLTKAAPLVKNGSSSLQESYRSAAKNISSDTYYGRAMKALN